MSEKELKKEATIKRIKLQISNGTAGSSGENIELYLRLNNTTDTLLINDVPLASSTYYTRTWTGSISVTSGSYIKIKMVTPAWTAFPSYPGVSAQIYLEY